MHSCVDNLRGILRYVSDVIVSSTGLGRSLITKTTGGEEDCITLPASSRTTGSFLE